MFVGRKDELAKLKTMYGSDKFEFAVIYGRRRIGKTTLIREFCKEKRAFYFVARESSDAENLRLISEELARAGFVNSGIEFKDWDSVFRAVAELAENERMILAIDEYPYLALANRSISSTLQAYIDGYFKQSKLFLILCGSSMSFMENQILGHQSPLYGRRTAQFKIMPFNFADSRGFLRQFSAEEQLALYGVTGGVPEYLSHIDEKQTMAENIISMFLSTSGALFEEPANLLKQELREPAVYNSIITAIASGASRLNEIATKNNMETNKASKYLSVLMSLGIVEKKHPFGETNSHKSIYHLADGMFEFYYKFAFPNMSAIAAGSGSLLYETEIEKRLPEFCGAVFEKCCAEYLWKLQNQRKLAFIMPSLGSWWGTNPKTRRKEEIDLMSVSHGTGLFCECKWRNTPVNMSVFRLLQERSEMFTLKEKYYCIFSRSGFESKLKEEATNNKQLTLVSYEDILNS